MINQLGGITMTINKSYNQLREYCLFKTGRTGVVLEVLDKLSANLFNDNKNIGSHLFKKDSKFTFTLVDSRSGEGRAIYYNLDPAEVILLNFLMSDGVPAGFKSRVGAYNALSGKEQVALREVVETFDSLDFSRFDRMMDYTANKTATAIHLQKNINTDGDNLLVRKLSISFEEAMKSDSKWKITIETGKAKKDTSKGNGLNVIKYGTYKETDKSYLMLEANEIVVPISEAASRVMSFKGMAYYLMQKSREEFSFIKNKERDFNGERISEWNAKGVPWYETPEYLEEQKKKQEENKNKQVESKEEEPETVCSDCGAETPKNVYDYSKRVMGQPLCFNCQKKHKK